MIHLSTKVSDEVKARFLAAGSQLNLRESELLRRIVTEWLPKDGTPEVCGSVPSEGTLRRMTIRLRRDQLVQVQAKAHARGLPSARWISLLISSHLDNSGPLDAGALAELRRSSAQIAVLGRSLSQIARRMNAESSETSMLHRLMEELCDQVKETRALIDAVVAASAESWKTPAP